MITKAIDKTRIDELRGYEVKQYTNQELEEKISIMKAETEAIISQKDEEISQKDKLISQKDSRIQRLEEFIQKKGLIIPK